jgi:hypothetical protein
MTDIKHFGVLGMKWGIRKRRSSGPDTSSEDHKTSRAIKSKKISEMSNEELKKLTTRLQLERQLKDLSAKEVSTGQKFVSEALSAHAKITAAALLALGTKSLVTIVKERLGRG